MTPAEIAHRFPRTDKYSPEWVAENCFGGNPLWQCEWLCERLDLRPGMRVLDLGCGRVKTSIFLAREFDVEVWGTDLWIGAGENLLRIRDAGLERRVFPLHADARALPFAGEFFDAILAVDCYSYFGTDNLYLNYLAHFVKPGGQLAIVGAGLVREMTLPIPKHLNKWWTPDMWCLHSADWWREHWEQTGIVEIEVADALDDGWKFWSNWHRTWCTHNTIEIDAVEADAGRFLTYNRVIARRRPDVKLEEFVWPDNVRPFLPHSYERKNLLRTGPV